LVTVKIAKGEGLTVKVKYEQEIETQETETETETQYDVRFDRLVEYRKANAGLSARSGDTDSSDVDMAYEWDSDTIVQEMVMDNWQNFSAIAEEGSLSTFSIANQDNTATFIFTVARDDSGSITANKMKIDFDLNGFPWTADDTFVALLCTVESEREVEVEEIEDSEQRSVTASRKTKDVKISFADAVDTIGFTPFGVFDWANTAEVRMMGNLTNSTAATESNLNATETVSNLFATESTTIQVMATSPASEASDAIAFSFVGNAAHRAVDIYWDPSAGVGYESGAAAISFMGVASLGIALVSMMMM
jgi:hypothetical protein